MSSTVQDLTKEWPVALQLVLDHYISEHGLQMDALLRVDLVLILLRLADDKGHNDFVRYMALERIGELTGRAITRCPSAMPPWPPKPVARHPVKVVTKVEPNECYGNTDMHKRYGVVRVGMTREQLLAHGATVRDISLWVKQGKIAFKEEMRMRA